MGCRHNSTVASVIHLVEKKEEEEEEEEQEQEQFT